MTASNGIYSRRLSLAFQAVLAYLNLIMSAVSPQPVLVSIYTCKFLLCQFYCSMLFIYSLVPQGGLVCEECPLGLSAFLSTRPPKGLKNIRYFCSILGHHLVIPNKSDGELHEIMVKLRGHSTRTGRGIEPTVRMTQI